MSTTPRTDAESEYVHESDGSGGTLTPRLVVDVGFACTLETELQACHAVMEEMAAALKSCDTDYDEEEKEVRFFDGERVEKALTSYANLKSQKP